MTTTAYSHLADAQASEFERSALFLDLKNRTHEHLLSRIEELGAEFGRWSQAAIAQFVLMELDSFIRLHSVPVNEQEALQVARALTRELTGLGPLQPLLEDPLVEDILINGHGNIYVSRGGVLQRETLHFKDDEHVLRIVRRILAPLGRRLDESSPMVDARLPDGSRVNAVIPPIALNGSSLTIRKFAIDRMTLRDLLDTGTLTEESADYLSALIRGKANIIISGGTGSGKTTTLNVLSSLIPEDQRIVTIEDSAELQINKPHVVRLESRPANVEGRGVVTIRDLVKNSLRMRPDRIIVGEVRDGTAFDMLQAMNTGHEGSLTTVHANSPSDALLRLESMSLMAGLELPIHVIRQQMSSALDVIVQQTRLIDGRRRITAISEVEAGENGEPVVTPIFSFHFASEGDNPLPEGLHPTGHPSTLAEKLGANGVSLPESLIRSS